MRLDTGEMKVQTQTLEERIAQLEAVVIKLHQDVQGVMTLAMEQGKLLRLNADRIDELETLLTFKPKPTVN